MEYRRLGKTGIKVSRLCFGSLTISPLQANLSAADGARLIQEAMDRGVNFLDTAELYDNYRHIREAMRGKPRDKLVIATKTYAYTREMAEKSLKKAMNEIKTDHIDLFLLHEQESELTLKGHSEAMEYFINARDKGYISAFGVSTHHIECVRAAAKLDEIEVIHPIVNIRGLGIADGGVEEMLLAVERAADCGRGIYAMKPLGGGNINRDFRRCMDFVLKIPHVDSIAVGMQCIEELEANLAFFENRPVDKKTADMLAGRKRRLIIEPWCEGCGSCIEACSQGALHIIDGKAAARQDMCTLCGYCAARCRNFYIKVI